MELSDVSVTGKVMTIKVHDSHMRRMTSVDLGRADTLAVSLELDRQSPGRATVGLRTGGRLSDPVMLGIFEGEDVRRADALYESVSEAMEKAGRRSAASKSASRAFAYGAASCVALFIAVSAGIGFASSKSSATTGTTAAGARAPAAVAQVAPAAPAPQAFRAAQPYAPPVQTAAQAPDSVPQFIEMPRGTVVEADQVLPDDGGDPPR